MGVERGRCVRTQHEQFCVEVLYIEDDFRLNSSPLLSTAPIRTIFTCRKGRRGAQ